MEEFNVSATAAQFIKTLLDHVHYYDNSQDSRIRISEWKPSHKYPVKIEINLEHANDPQKLEQLIETDKSLLAIMAPHSTYDIKSKNVEPSYEKNNPNNEPSTMAVLRLREKYSRLFDNTFNWVQFFKTTKVLGIPIYRSSFLYWMTFLVFVFCWNVHDFHNQDSSAFSKYEILGFGFISALCNIAVLFSIVKVWHIFKRTILDKMVRSISKNSNAIGGIRLNWLLRKLDFLPPLNRVIFVFLLVGPFMFSIKETPNFLEAMKLFESDAMTEWAERASRAVNTVSASSVVFERDFWKNLPLEILFFAPMFIIPLYSLDISVKRRKVLLSLRNLRGHLLYGNILDASINSCLKRAEHTYFEQSGFDHAICIVEDRIHHETKKRIQSQFYLVSVFVLSMFISIESYVSKLSGLLSP